MFTSLPTVDYSDIKVAFKMTQTKPLWRIKEDQDLISRPQAVVYINTAASAKEAVNNTALQAPARKEPVREPGLESSTHPSPGRQTPVTSMHCIISFIQSIHLN